MVAVVKSIKIVALLLLVFFVAANHVNAKTITRGDSAILKWTVTGGGTSCMGTTDYPATAFTGDTVSSSWLGSHSPNTGTATFDAVNGSVSDGFPHTYTFQCQDLLSGVTGSDTLTVNDCSGTSVWNGTSCVALPDLVAGSITASPNPGALNQSISFSMPVSNTGSAINTPFGNTITISTGGWRSRTIATLTANTLSSLASGASATVSASYSFSGPGTYRITACTDSSLLITESDELNNCSTLAFTVSNNPPATATLWVSTGGGARSSEVTINNGQSAELTWSSANALFCYPAGGEGVGFSTGGATSNSTGVSVRPSATSPYQIYCDGSGGRGSSDVTVNVLQPEVLVTADPLRVKSGGSSTISWALTDIKSCTATRNGVSWTPPGKNLSSSDSYRDAITGQTTYTFSCIDETDNAMAPQSKTVNILPIFKEF